MGGPGIVADRRAVHRAALGDPHAGDRDALRPRPPRDRGLACGGRRHEERGRNRAGHAEKKPKGYPHPYLLPNGSRLGSALCLSEMAASR